MSQHEPLPSTTNQVEDSRPFRPKARLLRTLGAELISNDRVAVMELVKNAYDADASVVVIRFVGPLTEGRGSIEIWDDGLGMDAQTLQEGWLDIASNTKARTTRTKKKRRVLGEKGIGRFSAAFLGQDMLLTTHKYGNNELTLLVDWTMFDRDDTYLDQIDVAWESREIQTFAVNGEAQQVFQQAGVTSFQKEQGTIVRIEKLRHPWITEEDSPAQNRKKVQYSRTHEVELLRTALARLVRGTAKEASLNQRFQIILSFENCGDDFAHLAGSIEAPVFDSPQYAIKGMIDANGNADLHYSSYATGDDRSITDKLWEHNDRAPLVGPFRIDLRVWDRDDKSLREYLIPTSKAKSEDNPISTPKEFRDRLDDVTGISVYRDGFRVMPFGERGDDWLGLDLRRVNNPTLRVSNNQIIGEVLITADDNKNLVDQSNREGFIDSAAYPDLRELIIAALSKLETERFHARPRKKPTTPSGLASKMDLSAISEAVRQRYPNDKELSELVRKQDRAIQEGLKEVRETLSRFSRLATLGTMIDTVLHDGRTPLAKASAYLDDTIISISSGSNRDIIMSNAKKIEPCIEQESRLFDRLAPFSGRKVGHWITATADALLMQAKEMLQAESKDRVDVIIQPSNISLKVDSSEVLVVLTNLLINAIYWAYRNRNQRPPTVLMYARLTDDGSAVLGVSDTGPGVAENDRASIFEPYFTTKPDGVGLGLNIAGQAMMDTFGGRLNLVEPGPLPGATFEAVFEGTK